MNNQDEPVSQLDDIRATVYFITPSQNKFGPEPSDQIYLFFNNQVMFSTSYEAVNDEFFDLIKSNIFTSGYIHLCSEHIPINRDPSLSAATKIIKTFNTKTGEVYHGTI